MNVKLANLLIGLILAISPLTMLVNATGNENNGLENGDWQPGTLVVDLYGMGNYTMIQDAVDNADPGTIIYVTSGMYLENVVVDKSVTLMGQGDVEIDGDLNIGIRVTADHVNISGFTVFSGMKGISVIDCNGCNISGNCLSDNFEYGIYLGGVNYSVISNNICNSNGGRYSANEGAGGTGIYLENSHNNVVTNNHCDGNEWYEMTDGQFMQPAYATGIGLAGSDHNTIRENIVTNNSGYGMNLAGDFNRIMYNQVRTNHFSYYDVRNERYHYSVGSIFNGDLNLILGNDIRNNFQGISLTGDRNLILNNTCKEHKVADISLERGAYYNTIAYNTFFIYQQRPIMVYDNSSFNFWNLDSAGNYWSDYADKYPNATNDSRVWDTPYFISGSAGNYDTLPLCAPRGIENATPTAEAGTDITIEQHRSPVFDGRGSESCYTIINYTWNFMYGGSSYSMYGATPRFIFHNVGVYNAYLTVSNLLGETDTDMIKVYVKDSDPPVADAGPDIVVSNERSFLLDGTGSTDNVGITNYTWTFSYNDENLVFYDRSLKYIFSIPGKYRLSLTVSDARGNRNSDEAFITVVNDNRPIARAGDEIFITQYDTAFFNASESFDDIGIVNYSWSIFHDQMETIMYGISISFTFDGPGVCPVTLKVIDTGGKWDLDRVFVNVRPKPTFHADAGRNITINGGETAAFAGSVSGDEINSPKYRWLFNYDNENKTLTGLFPTFIFEIPGNYSVRFMITDPEGNWAEDSIWVHVVDVNKSSDGEIHVPVADAGEDITAVAGSTVKFDATGSTDIVAINNYTWTFVHDERPWELTGPIPSFIFEKPGEFLVILTVTNIVGNSDQDIMMVTVIPKTTESESDVARAPDEIEPTNITEVSSGKEPEPMKTDLDETREESVTKVEESRKSTGTPIWIWMLALAVACMVGIVAVHQFMRKRKRREPGQDRPGIEPEVDLKRTAAVEVEPVKVKEYRKRKMVRPVRRKLRNTIEK